MAASPLVAALVFLATVATAAPAAARELAAPEGAPPSAAASVPDRLPNPNEYFSTPIEGTAFGAGGARGSLGLGLLLPAIGAGVNAAYVQSANRERGARASALTGVDLDEMLRAIRAPAATAPPDTAPEAAAEGSPDASAEAPQTAAPAPPSPPERAYELAPAVQLWFWTDETFSLGCTITATLQTGGRRPWVARYQLSPHGDYDLSAESMERARAAIEPCLREANRLYEGHVDRTFVTGERRRVRTESYTARFRIVEAEAPSRLIAHDALGMIEFAPGRAMVLD